MGREGGHHGGWSSRVHSVRGRGSNGRNGTMNVGDGHCVVVHSANPSGVDLLVT